MSSLRLKTSGLLARFLQLIVDKFEYWFVLSYSNIHDAVFQPIFCLILIQINMPLTGKEVKKYNQRANMWFGPDQVGWYFFCVTNLFIIIIMINSQWPNLHLNLQSQVTYNVHLMIKMKVTLTDDEGHRRRSTVTNNELMVISHNSHSQTSCLVPRYNTTSDN